ncbi:MAG: hypothetical protein HYS26_01585 [Candidatus Kaiserbacteria bacterium]|nr:MAG: hypothetical protein HYS26_01585 [Candidatus Kaiserbacteria bacterium]
MNIFNQSAQRQRGFTLLLAALVASVVLALGAAIFKLAQKEITLSSIGRDSQYAFYAADTGAECALFWDLRYGYFATSSPPGVTPECDAQAIIASGRLATFPYTMTFQFAPSGFCTNVAVEKTKDAQNAIRTVVRADGYNVIVPEGNAALCDSMIAAAPRALQRSVELHY